MKVINVSLRIEPMIYYNDARGEFAVIVLVVYYIKYLTSLKNTKTYTIKNLLITKCCKEAMLF